MKRLLDAAIDRPIATCMLLLCMMVLGVVAVFRLPLDFMPVILEPEIDVEVPFPGSHPLETLRDIAIPIEEEIATIPGVTRISTRASSGRANIEVNFDWEANIEIKKMEVREAVDRARDQLPDGIGFIKVKGEIAAVEADGAILQGRISAERDLSESWELLDRRIKRPIERIKGVASVSLYGVEPQQIRIELDLAALQSHGVRTDDVLGRINAANLDMDLGSVRGDLVRYDVRAEARFANVEEIRDLSIGRGLRVGDVATVEMRQPRVDYGRHLDQRFAIGIDVFKEPSANTVAVVDEIIAKIDEIESDPALSGISLLVWMNQGAEIRKALSGLRNAGIFGGFLAVFVLYFFLRRFRNTAIVAVAIPFSLIVTCGGMYILGAQFNVLTLLGLMLGVGMLVDNAVVVMENIHRLQGKGLDPSEAAKIGARDVATAVVASTATTVTVWSWLFTADRSEMTIMMGQTALTICLAVVCSLVISLTFIPLAAARVYTGSRTEEGFLLRKLLPAYRTLLGWTLRHRLIALILLLTLAASTWYPYSKLEISGDITRQQLSVQINYEVHDPASKEVREGYVDTVEAWLAERKDELGFESMYSWYSENRGCMTRLYLSPDRASKDDLKELRERLTGNLPHIAGVKLQVGEREWYRRGQGKDGRRMVSVSINGEDPEFLETLASRVERRMREMPEPIEIWGPSLQGQKELRILIDTDKSNALGVTPRAVADAVGFAFRGRQLRRFQTEVGEIEMMVSLPEELQDGGMTLLQNLPIPVGDTEVTAPLSAVADVAISRMPPQIRRTDRETTSRVNIQFDEDEYTTDEAQALVRARMDDFELPDGYSWSFGDWGRDRDRSMATMLNGVLLSLLIVFILMAALFESFAQPTAILITVPFAFCGACWSLWLGGFELDVVGFIGVVILIGIVVNNGIVMVDHVKHLRDDGHERVEALLIGCGNRLRPILMTAITTIFGLMPLAIGSATVAGAYIDSLAVAVIGGLAMSTVFTLIALPVWYTAVEDLFSVIARLLPRVSGAKRLTLPQGGIVMHRRT